MPLGRMFFDGQKDLTIIISHQSIFKKENIMLCYLATFVEGLFQVTCRVKVIFIGMDDSAFVLQ